MAREPSPALNSLPGVWLDALFAALQRPGQSRNDILRRSAGLPVAVLAVLLADPPGARRVCACPRKPECCGSELSVMGTLLRGAAGRPPWSQKGARLPLSQQDWLLCVWSTLCNEVL